LVDVDEPLVDVDAWLVDVDWVWVDGDLSMNGGDGVGGGIVENFAPRGRPGKVGFFALEDGFSLRIAHRARYCRCGRSRGDG